MTTKCAPLPNVSFEAVFLVSKLLLPSSLSFHSIVTCTNQLFSSFLINLGKQLKLFVTWFKTDSKRLNTTHRTRFLFNARMDEKEERKKERVSDQVIQTHFPQLFPLFRFQFLLLLTIIFSDYCYFILSVCLLSSLLLRKQLKHLKLPSGSLERESERIFIMKRRQRNWERGRELENESQNLVKRF